MASGLQNAQTSVTVNGDFCMLDDIPSHFPGVIFDPNDNNNVFDYPLTRVLVQLVLIFSVTHSLHMFFKRFHMPRIISEIMAGLILGRTIMARIYPQLVFELFFEKESELEVLSKVGFTFYMFLVGLKMDPSTVGRFGWKSFIIGLSLVAIPASVSYWGAFASKKYLPHYRRAPTENIIATQLIVPFPVIANLLVDLKIMNSELGRLALASGLVSHLMSAWLTTFMAILTLKDTDVNLSMETLAFSTTLIVFTILFIRPLAAYIIRHTSEGKPVKSVYTGIVASVVLAFSVLSDNVGLQYHFGPFLVGLTIPDGPPLGSTLVERWETMVSGLLAPLMITYCSLKVDLFVFFDLTYLRLIWLIFLVMFLLKFATVFGMAMLCKVPYRDSISLSLILNIQGIVEIAIYNDFYRNQVLDSDIFNVVILSVLIIAPLVTLLVKTIHGNEYAYQGYQKRSILSPACNLELRVLACIHRQDDALAMIKLLEVAGPSHESPINAYALNLVELVGRATPLLINHSLGQKETSKRSLETIELFQKLEKKFPDLVTTHAFTAISLTRFMHHDICSLAFEKLVSLVILPFHKKWNQHGQIVHESSITRTINQNVLETAPCSVAILIDRRKIRHESSGSSSAYHVGVLFLGGEDDREAVAFSKRMANSLREVELTVVRIIGTASDVGGGEEQWDAILDAESLKEIKMKSMQKCNVLYKEERVKDGADVVKILNVMEEAFDLIIVGRRHRDDSPLLSSLTEWSELPELGAIGDILASSDVRRPVSVLVMQQQVLKNKK